MCIIQGINQASHPLPFWASKMPKERHRPAEVSEVDQSYFGFPGFLIQTASESLRNTSASVQKSGPYNCHKSI